MISLKDFLTVVQIILAALIIGLILLQNRGSGLGSAFAGGEAAVFRARRGAEKLLHYTTIILCTLFGFLSLFLVWYRS
jgi:preprotein translocase subunit SecG